MENRNNKISLFQFSTIIFFIISSLFVGTGFVNIFLELEQDSWILTIFSYIVGFIPLLIIIYIASYKPDKNIFEKNIILFGKWIGNIINIILCLVAGIILIISLNSISTFVISIYLTKTPFFAVSIFFICSVIYAVIKGVEVIGRSSEMFFYISILVVGIIISSLFYLFKFDELKPILSNGFMPIIKNSIQYLGYIFTPLSLLLVIPKNDIINNKKYNKYLVLGYTIGFVLLFLVFFLIPGVITGKVASLYRYPAYYTHRKINIGKTINNVENFTNVHWFFHDFIIMAICIYFIKIFFKNIFKIKKVKTLNIINIIIGLIAVCISSMIFKGPLSLLNFMKYNFTYYISSIIIIIFIISIIFIFFNKRKAKKVTT